jgi:hypothetical protein
MFQFLKNLTCNHSEIKALPIIEEVLLDKDLYREVGIFNQVDFQCTKCAKAGRATLPIILTTKTPGPLINKLMESFIASQLGAKEVKIV